MVCSSFCVPPSFVGGREDDPSDNSSSSESEESFSLSVLESNLKVFGRPSWLFTVKCNR